MAIQLPPVLSFIVVIIVFAGLFFLLNLFAWLGFISVTLQPIINVIAGIIATIGGLLGLAMIKTRKLHAM